MIEITFLGGSNEVGRCAFLIDNGVEKFLWDYGLNVTTMGIPKQPPTNLDGVFLSHAHLDHSGVLPELYKRGYTGNSFMTPATLELATLLLEDAIKVQGKKGLEPFFLHHDVEKMTRLTKCVDFNKKMEFKKSSVRFFSAGHIPGSASILLETQGKKILYTGDVKFTDTSLMKKAYTDYKDLDAVLIESTYTYKDHPDRKKIADELREHIQDVVYKDGIVLMPCFAVGRTQEMLTLVYDLGFTVYLDGMGKEATKRILMHPKSVNDPKKLRKAFSYAHKIERGSNRTGVTKKPCIIICTSGMLTGGPVHTYIKKLYKRRECSIVLSGYMVDGTLGRQLLETGTFPINGENIKIGMQQKSMDFSAHCGRTNIIKFLEKTNPKKVFLVHGEDTDSFAKELKQKEFNAIAPKNGEKIRV